MVCAMVGMRQPWRLRTRPTRAASPRPAEGRVHDIRDLQPLPRHGAAMESNHPTGGLLRPAGFEDRMGHQTPAAPRPMLEPVKPGYGRDRGEQKSLREADP